MTTEVTTNPTANQETTKQQLDKNNNDNIINDNQLDVITKIDPGKYPLENSWSFWFFKNDKNKLWKDNLVYITSVEFVEDFWAYVVNLPYLIVFKIII
jgi:hypothetical protein